MSKRRNYRESRTKKKGSVKRKIIIIVLVLLLILDIVAIIGWSYIHSKLSKVNIQEINLEEIGLTEETEDALKNYRTIALFGIDSRADDYGMGNRSDSMILAIINKTTSEVQLISVYRDCYLELVEDGYTTLDKLTHAYSYGGPQNALLALNTNLDLNIKEYITVNFSSLAMAIDAIGGVEITIEDQEELDELNHIIPETAAVAGKSADYVYDTGTQTLDGIQAVSYARIRKVSGGDYKRSERQRTVINAMLKKMKKMDLGQIDNFLDVVLPHVSTNMSEGDILSFVPQLIKINISNSIGWPYQVQGISLERWFGVPCTLESNVIKLHKEVYKQEDYTLPENVKRINDAIIERTGYSTTEL